MTDLKDVGEVLAESLGFVLNRTERSLQSFLDTTVDGLAALREIGVDAPVGRTPVQLFVYDFLPKVEFIDDIKVRPNHYRASLTVMSQLKRLMYDRFFVSSAGELFEVAGGDFKALFNTSNVFHYHEAKTTDYFYL